MLKPTAGDRLRHARWAKDLTLHTLAREARVSTATIQKLERGGTVKEGQIIYRLATALDIDPTELFLDSEVAS